MDFALFLFLIFAMPILFAFGVKHSTSSSGLFYVGVFCLALLAIVAFTGAMLAVSSPAVSLTTTTATNHTYSPPLPDAATLERLAGHPIPFAWDAANNQTHLRPGSPIWYPPATQSVTVSYPDDPGQINPVILHLNDFAPYNQWRMEIQSEIPDGSEIESIQVAGSIDSGQPTITHMWKLYFRGGGSGGSQEEYSYTSGPTDGIATFDNTFNGSDIRGVFRVGVEHVVNTPARLNDYGGYGTIVDQTITFDRVDIKLTNPNAGTGTTPTSMLAATTQTSHTVIVDLSTDVNRMVLMSIFLSTGIVAVFVVLGTLYRVWVQGGRI